MDASVRSIRLALAVLIFSLPECAHAAVDWQAKGAYGVGTTSAVAAMPTGHTTDDILIITCESTDSGTLAGTPTNPGDSWTTIFEESQAVGGAVTTLTLYAKRHDGSEADVTVSGVLNHISCSMSNYRGAVATGTAWSVSAGTGADTGNGNCATFDPTPDNALIICEVASGRDANNSTNFSGWTNASLTTPQEREDNHTNTASGGGFGHADGTLASGASGSTTVTIAVSVPWRSVHVAIEPAPAAATTGTGWWGQVW